MLFIVNIIVDYKSDLETEYNRIQLSIVYRKTAITVSIFVFQIKFTI